MEIGENALFYKKKWKAPVPNEVKVNLAPLLAYIVEGLKRAYPTPLRLEFHGRAHPQARSPFLRRHHALSQQAPTIRLVQLTWGSFPFASALPQSCSLTLQPPSSTRRLGSPSGPCPGTFIPFALVSHLDSTKKHVRAEQSVK